MTRTFKLIKEYPGSPELNAIEEPLDIKRHMMSNGNYGYNFDNKEYWKEVIEKDYKILKFRRITYDSMCYTNVGDIVDADENNNKNYNSHIYRFLEIYSVKRLSDGKIFTVGDDVVFNKTNNFDITSFHISESNKIACGDMELKYIEHYKKPLFTTEDGVDIFEDDDIYWIWDDFSGGIKCNKFNDDCGEYDVKLVLNKHEGIEGIGFSTKEKAEEYILMNKPCLSINEVMNVAYNPVESYTSSSRKLKEIVKSKL